MARTVCVLTGTRAEYGLLRRLVLGLRDDPRVQTRVLVTGSHLVPSLGETWKEIEADGVPIDARVDIGLGDDSPVGVARSLAAATSGVAEALERLAPDVLVLLGDRYEVLGAAQAAMLLGIPVAHLHGGESTEGAIDEAIRHAVTKMSHLHFVSTETYRRRVIQLGEQPDHVFTVGAFGLDAIHELELLSREELSQRTGLDLTGEYLLVTYHPVTLEPGGVDAAVDALTGALAESGLPVLVTKANADPGGRAVNRRIEAWQASRPGRVALVASLGQHAYLSAMVQAAAVVGNSSSGIIEAPAAGVPTVDVGDRQRGRLRGPSVLHAPEERAAIAAAIGDALALRRTGADIAAGSPYGAGGAADATREVLATYPLDGLLKKRFHDLPSGMVQRGD